MKRLDLAMILGAALLLTGCLVVRRDTVPGHNQRDCAPEASIWLAPAHQANQPAPGYRRLPRD